MQVITYTTMSAEQKKPHQGPNYGQSNRLVHQLKLFIFSHDSNLYLRKIQIITGQGHLK